LSKETGVPKVSRESHKIASFEAIRVYNFAKTPGSRLLFEYSYVTWFWEAMYNGEVNTLLIYFTDYATVLLKPITQNTVLIMLF